MLHTKALFKSCKDELETIAGFLVPYDFNNLRNTSKRFQNLKQKYFKGQELWQKIDSSHSKDYIYEWRYGVLCAIKGKYLLVHFVQTSTVSTTVEWINPEICVISWKNPNKIKKNL